VLIKSLDCYYSSFVTVKLSSVFAELIRSEVEQVTKTLHAEFDVERSHHQKMLKDHARLQQRLENLQNSVNLQLPISAVSNVSRSPSNVSNFSSGSESTSDRTEQVCAKLILLCCSYYSQRCDIDLYLCGVDLTYAHWFIFSSFVNVNFLFDFV